MPSWPGRTAKMPPPTPLLAGMPTVVSQSPAASYIPQVAITLSTRRSRAPSSTVSPLNGLVPELARVAAIIERSRQLSSIEHCRK